MMKLTLSATSVSMASALVLSGHVASYDSVKLDDSMINFDDSIAQQLGQCSKGLLDGTTNSRLYSCDRQTCCTLDEYREDADSCMEYCECQRTEMQTVTEEVVVGEYPTVVRGVPIFKQYDAKDRNGFQPIGCGAIALAELALYYGAWGYTGILDAYTSGGQIQWTDVADDAAEYLDTWIRNNASPNKVRKVTGGIENFFEELGYSANVNKVDVSNDEEEMENAYGQMKTSILQGRPVYFGFDTSDTEGGGIGSKGDNFGFIDHYGLIVGFDDSGETPTIEINMGWGDVTGTVCGTFLFQTTCVELENGVATYDWVIGRGKVYMWFVQLDASQKTVVGGSVVEECPIPNPTSIYEPNSVAGSSGVHADIGATFESMDSDVPLISTLMAGSDCQVRGGTKTREESYSEPVTVVDSTDCSARYNTYDSVLDGTWEPEVVEIEINA